MFATYCLLLLITVCSCMQLLNLAVDTEKIPVKVCNETLGTLNIDDFVKLVDESYCVDWLEQKMSGQPEKAACLRSKLCYAPPDEVFKDIYMKYKGPGDNF